MSVKLALNPDLNSPDRDCSSLSGAQYLTSWDLLSGVLRVLFLEDESTQWEVFA